MSLPYPPQPDEDLDGGAALDDVAAFIGRYVAFPTVHALVAVVLWAAHTHAVAGTWYVTPRLVLDSAEPGSGKTRVLELLALLVQRPEMTISATVAAIFRMLAEQPYTLLFDEVDAIFNPKNGGNYEDLRALLNAGYKQGATIARCVGDAKAMKVQRFPVFAPVALAGLAGRMPSTITTRAVTIHMRRRGPGERVEPFRERDAEWFAEPLRERLAEWVGDLSAKLAAARPVMPDGVEDRPAEVWEPLLAIADEGGGEWPARARAACRHFVLESDPGELSLGVRLLSDVRGIFTRGGIRSMPSAELVAALVALEEAPWADLYGKELDQRRLAKELDRYAVRPIQYKQNGNKHRGYVTWPTERPPQAGLADAWARYLNPGGTAGTTGTGQVNPVPNEQPVPVATGTAPATGTGLSSEVPPVPEVPQQSCSRCGHRRAEVLGLCRPCAYPAGLDDDEVAVDHA
ncbi:DUF3631 domain-containing protein [Pseudonocardia sp. MH-G8]|uniref:DUF3631 domain-containing protein n=1 Tax=Pseudonocardia sp. MH-G8 TaxID=1854588 RepID=UPI001E41A3E0|nr:DUF3631 domain-containing protein [Pseudonocardia sp. MH-G8]